MVWARCLTCGKPCAYSPSPVRVTRGTAARGLRNLHRKKPKQVNIEITECNEAAFVTFYLPNIVPNPKNPISVLKSDAIMSAPCIVFMDSLNLWKMEPSKTGTLLTIYELNKAITNLFRICVYVESIGSSNGYRGDIESIGTTHHHRKPGSKRSLQECVYARNKERSVDYLSLLYLLLSRWLVNLNE